MNKILMVTPLYPLPTKENQVSYVCHYFTREWVKMGYEVIVIHLQPVHCILWHFVERLFKRKGSATSYSKRLYLTENYLMDSVPVYRIPVFQITPRFVFSEKELVKFSQKVDSILNYNEFVPDVIVGHCMSPHIIPILNRSHNTKTVMISHGDHLYFKSKFRNWEEIVDSYDAWGFRAQPIKIDFEKVLKKVNREFICYSGIPESYLTDKNSHVFDNPLHNFLFVGELISRKYPLQVIDALQKAYPQRDYNLNYVGTGALLGALKQKVEKLGLKDKVSILGRIPRNNIIGQYDNADCMIMISYGEAYGLVYLEAMARGCITIASRNEGIDGVIIDGKNGFLCKSGDSEELASIINRINQMSPEERYLISQNAIETAKSLTDYKAAQMYIDELRNIVEQ